ncbi:MAG: chemotaxis protein [Deltaproteobacteria bacterium]|nr:MAG: chemotaxis protein [Deltaproteobacteria bacterium]
MSEEKKQPIIIKRVKKGGEGHHGGSWKVAYADFVTAMMAFFLLLWLITMSSPEKRARISSYFKHFSLFEQSGVSFLGESSQIFEHPGGESKDLTYEQGKGAGDINPNRLRAKLKEAIKEQLAEIEDQFVIDILDEGVRIQIVDKEGSSLFAPGSDQLSEKGKWALQLIAENLKDVRNKIVVEGHTDSLPFRRGKITNWELSILRAAAARRMMEEAGLSPDRFAKVIGYGDTMPLIKTNPADPRNRRISIIILFNRDGLFRKAY